MFISHKRSNVRNEVSTYLANASAVVRGFLIRSEAAANFCGLYSTNGLDNAIPLRSSASTPRLKALSKAVSNITRKKRIRLRELTRDDILEFEFWECELDRGLVQLFYLNPFLLGFLGLFFAEFIR